MLFVSPDMRRKFLGLFKSGIIANITLTFMALEVGMGNI